MLIRAITCTRPLVRRAAVPLAARPILQRRFEHKSSKGLTEAERQADWIAPKVSFEEVKYRSEQPPMDSYLIDVRELNEIQQGSIPSSVALPLSGIAASLHLSPEEFFTAHGYKKPRPHSEIIFYCRTGKRSASAADIARRNGFRNVKNYEGSWVDWVSRTQTPPSS